MIARLRTAAKFFTIGLALGILFAPDSGVKVRERLIARIRVYLPGDRHGE
jgi:hypothetical protein